MLLISIFKNSLFFRFGFLKPKKLAVVKSSKAMENFEKMIQLECTFSDSFACKEDCQGQFLLVKRTVRDSIEWITNYFFLSYCIIIRLISTKFYLAFGYKNFFVLLIEFSLISNTPLYCCFFQSGKFKYNRKVKVCKPLE